VLPTVAFVSHNEILDVFLVCFAMETIKYLEKFLQLLIHVHPKFATKKNAVLIYLKYQTRQNFTG
jgi:hypothetical protein